MRFFVGRQSRRRLDGQPWAGRCSVLAGPWQGTDLLRKGLHLRPIRELDHLGRVGRALGDVHDEADHLPVNVAQRRVVQPTGKHPQQLRLPVQLLEQLDHVGVGVGLVFLGLARHDVDAEQRIGFALQQRLVLLDEGHHLRAMFAVADAGTNDDAIKRCQLKRVRLLQRHQRGWLPQRRHGSLHAFTDQPGVAVNGGVDEKVAV